MNPNQDLGSAEHLGPLAERLRRALIANLGRHDGDEAFAEAMLFAWSHPEKLDSLENPVAYLFRVGKSQLRKSRRQVFKGPPRSSDHQAPDFEPALDETLRRLSPRQRTAVVLVVGWNWSHTEVAELLGISKSSVQRHVERGMTHLRTALGAEP